MHYNTHNPPLCNTVMLRNVLRAQGSVKLAPGIVIIIKPNGHFMKLKTS